MTKSAHACAFDVVRGFLGRIFTSAEGDTLESVAELDLSFTQARIVLTLAHHEHPLAIGDLADMVGLSAASTGRNVENLVQKDLVERTENPEDRRVKLVALCPAGRAVAESHVKAKEDAVRTMLDDLDSDQCLALIEALKPLVKETPHVN